MTKPDGSLSQKCSASIPCPSKSQTCDIHGCAAGTLGVCVVYPLTCPTVWSPVCGCDNKTYGNDCERLKAGVALAYTGQCKIPLP